MEGEVWLLSKINDNRMYEEISLAAYRHKRSRSVECRHSKFVQVLKEVLQIQLYHSDAECLILIGQKV